MVAAQALEPAESDLPQRYPLLLQGVGACVGIRQCLTHLGRAHTRLNHHSLGGLRVLAARRPQSGVAALVCFQFP